MKQIIGYLLIVISVFFALPILYIFYSNYISPLFNDDITIVSDMSLGIGSMEIKNPYMIFTIFITIPLSVFILGLTLINTNKEKV